MSTMITTAIDEAVTELVPLVGASSACRAVGLARASYYRTRRTATATGTGAGVAASDGSPCLAPAVETVAAATRARQQQVQPRGLSGKRCKWFDTPSFVLGGKDH